MQTLSFDFNHTKNGSDTVRRIVLLLCMVWFITVLLAALSGGFEMAVGEPSAAILFAVIAPVVMFAVSYMTISAFRDWVLMFDIALFKNASAVSRRKFFYGIPLVCWILLLLFLWVWQPAPMSGYTLQTWPAATSWANFH